ncbi:MAG: hypothetical protein ACI9UA_002412 [Pseudoalteromonas tetraodonis]|jgi:hypothetical protein
MAEQQPIPKAISSILVTYTVSVLCCFIWLGIMLKLQGYGSGERWQPGWTWPARFLRQWGLLFVLLPVPWAFYALASYRIDRGWLSAHLALGIGVLMTVVITLWFVHTALNPINRWPLFYLR